MKTNLPKIFSFSGRKHSGKTELARLCVEYNYELINFADALKELICNCLEITKEYLEEYKDIKVDSKYNLTKQIKYISNEINIEESIVSNYLSVSFDSIRKILQIIGTDLIRNYNHLWHINKIKQKILNNPDKYYCVGDTRFLDEKEMLEDLNCECWFIIRPNMLNISNHYSEINLQWKNFGNNIIINNLSKENFCEKWKNYLQSLKFDSKTVFNQYKYNDDNDNDNNDAFLEITNESSYVIGLLTANNNIFKLDNPNKYVVEIYKNIVNSNKPICINKSIYSFECTNPFIIENTKLWNFKSSEPFFLENNIEMLKYWIIGLIDICGDIKLCNKTLMLHIISSKEIIDYLFKILPNGEILSLQNDQRENLFQLNFYDENCIYLYKWFGEAINIGLKRKWGIIKNFIYKR